MAVGIVVGGAFTTLVKSGVSDLLMPPIGLLTGGLSFSDQFLVLRPGETAGPYPTLKEAQEAGAVVMTYGNFLDNCISLAIVAVVMFFLVRWINKLRSPDTPPAPNTKPCPFCKTAIHMSATRCPSCTSQQPEPA